MKILVFAKPGAKRASIKKMRNIISGFDECFSITVHEPAYNGRANEAIKVVIAEHFGTPVRLVRIVAGHTVHRKIVMVSTPQS